VKPEASSAAATAAERGCARCGQPLREDWNFCPTCALPVRVDDGVLSPQIRVLRTAAEPTEEPGSWTLLRWAGIGAAGVLLLGTAAVGILLWQPGARTLLAGSTPRPPDDASLVPAATIPGTKFEWVGIPAGSFKCGPPAEGRAWTEEVDVPAFEILKHEVTNAQWLEYVRDRWAELITRAGGRPRSSVPSNWPWRKRPDLPAPADEEPYVPEGWEALPVRGISFDEAQNYCAWLRDTGRVPGARIPSEDEWEKAARGEDGRPYPWGPDFMVKTTEAGRTVEVEGALVLAATPSVVYYSATDVSPYKVLHMGGNVSEWTDLWGRRGNEAPGPWDRDRVIRGASFQIGREDGRIYARTWNNEVRMERGMSALDVGFRLARTPLPADAAPKPPDGR
jgi:formylglycine-generating enzyme required for sulfatase activity